MKETVQSRIAQPTGAFRCIQPIGDTERPIREVPSRPTVPRKRRALSGVSDPSVPLERPIREVPSRPAVPRKRRALSGVSDPSGPLERPIREVPSRPVAHQGVCRWSGWPDSNRRPPAPKAGALTGLRYTPTSATIVLTGPLSPLPLARSQDLNIPLSPNMGK